MHELSLACTLVDMACERARQAGAERVVAIELGLGVLAGVMREALVFGFEAACCNTPAEGARIEIRDEPAAGRCRACGAQCELDTFSILCPQCGEPCLSVSGGDQLLLRAIEVE